MSRIFLDTNLFIYAFEGHPEWGLQVVDLVERIKTRGHILCTSTLTIGEVLIKPLEVGDQTLIDSYRAYFHSPEVEVIGFDSEAALNYATIRQNRNIRPPDGIQLACAAAGGCQLFLTNDERLTRCIVPGVPFITSLAHAPL